MKRHTKHSPVRLCVLAALMAGLSGSVWAEDRGTLSAEETAANAKTEAITVIASNREGTIGDLVNQWLPAATALGYPADAWAADFTSTLQGASNAQLYDAQNATSYNAVRAILQGRSVPVSADGLAGTANLGDSTNDLTYTPVTPCRVLDTRSGTGIYDGPIPGGQTRNYYVEGSNALLAPQGHTAGTGCSSPKGEAAGIAANFTVVPTVSGHIRVFPYLAPLPTASFLNFQPGANLANAGIIATCYLCGPDLSIYNNASVEYLADVMGYFYPVSTSDPVLNKVQDVSFTSSFTANSPLLSDDVIRFVGPTVNLSITQPGQKVFMTATHALGANVAAATNLDLFPCYRLTGSVATPTTVGAGIFDHSSAPNQRPSFNINGVIEGLSSGSSYDVGMCYRTNSANWTNNEYGYVSGMVLKD